MTDDTTLTNVVDSDVIESKPRSFLGAIIVGGIGYWIGSTWSGNKNHGPVVVQPPPIIHG